MKNRTIALAIVFSFLAAAGTAAAGEQSKPQDNARQKMEQVEKAGVIEVIKADPAKQEKYDTVLLKADKETFKLLPGKDKKLFKPLAGMNGMNITVKGDLVPPKPPKYPLAAIKVASYSEAKAGKAEKPAKAAAQENK